ncbi:MAG: isocitrate/isopropylmalate family dehydrogenase [Myxococcota bacterium]
MSTPKTSFRVTVIGGDGIGPEVTAVGADVLRTLAELRGWDLALDVQDLGADRYLRDGTTFPEEVAADIRDRSDAVLLGALGDPRVPGNEHARDILFGLRFGLDLYCNVRPVQCLHERLLPLKRFEPADVDFTVFRENTEGIYVGMGGHFKKGTPDEIAIQEDVNSRKGVERVIRAAFAHAERTGAGSVHMADKHNAMVHAHELWHRVFKEVAAEHPGLEAHHVYVDALCLYLVQDPRPFEVIVTCNLFGDIVTDLAAGLQGGMGMAASANVRPASADGTGPRCAGLFEPVHGSAPPLAGKDVANPFATVLTVGQLLMHLGHPAEEARLRGLVERGLREGNCTRDVGGELGTKALGAWVCEQLRAEG